MTATEREHKRTHEKIDWLNSQVKKVPKGFYDYIVKQTKRYMVGHYNGRHHIMRCSYTQREHKYKYKNTGAYYCEDCKKEHDYVSTSKHQRVKQYNRYSFIQGNVLRTFMLTSYYGYKKPEHYISESVYIHMGDCYHEIHECTRFFINAQRTLKNNKYYPIGSTVNYPSWRFFPKSSNYIISEGYNTPFNSGVDIRWRKFLKYYDGDKYPRLVTTLASNPNYFWIGVDPDLFYALYRAHNERYVPLNKVDIDFSSLSYPNKIKTLLRLSNDGYSTSISSLFNRLEELRDVVPIQILKRLAKENNYSLNLLKDYIDMTNRNGIKPVVPYAYSDLLKKHDAMVKFVNKNKIEKMLIDYKKENESIITLHNVLQPYEVYDPNVNLHLKFASNLNDFLIEGQQLHHCVSGSNYFISHAKGKRLIGFVREKPDKPLYTFDFSIEDRKLTQFRGRYNSAPPEDIGVWLERKLYDSFNQESFQKLFNKKGVFKCLT